MEPQSYFSATVADLYNHVFVLYILCIHLVEMVEMLKLIFAASHFPLHMLHYNTANR